MFVGDGATGAVSEPVIITLLKVFSDEPSIAVLPLKVTVPVVPAVNVPLFVQLPFMFMFPAGPVRDLPGLMTILLKVFSLVPSIEVAPLKVTVPVVPAVNVPLFVQLPETVMLAGALRVPELSREPVSAALPPGV